MYYYWKVTWFCKLAFRSWGGVCGVYLLTLLWIHNRLRTVWHSSQLESACDSLHWSVTMTFLWPVMWQAHSLPNWAFNHFISEFIYHKNVNSLFQEWNHLAYIAVKYCKFPLSPFYITNKLEYLQVKQLRWLVYYVLTYIYMFLNVIYIIWTLRTMISIHQNWNHTF